MLGGRGCGERGVRLQVVEDLGVGQIRGEAGRGAGLGETEICGGC